jgi:hypothetical protein
MIEVAKVFSQRRGYRALVVVKEAAIPTEVSFPSYQAVSIHNTDESIGCGN